MQDVVDKIAGLSMKKRQDVKMTVIVNFLNGKLVHTVTKGRFFSQPDILGREDKPVRNIKVKGKRK